MPLLSGSRLGTYEIAGSLGAGGMGEVYRARDPRLGRDVAVKVLPDDLALDVERLARFEHEARILASLNHPNVVTIYSIEEAKGTRFLTMELVEGRSVADLIAPQGLAFTQVLDVLIPVTEALAAAHEKGVIHRDLKPANVMLSREGRVKVLDFGLAKVLGGAENVATSSLASISNPPSVAGEVRGTVLYMAPEQLFGETVDAASDLFSLGIVAFEMVTGQRPFVGKTFWEITAAIMREFAPPISSVREAAPAELERIIGRCLQRERSARYASANALLVDLRALRRQLDGESLPPTRHDVQHSASIAVLPFANRSANEEDVYFSDGLADELLGLLAKIKGLRVSARASSFRFRGTGVALSEVGRALNVATLLDGSVRRSGNRVRISVQLIKVPDGYHLWSETYDRTLDDIFAVQDDIARSVVKELRSTLLGEVADSGASDRAHAEVHQAARGRSRDAEAHRLYLLARHFMDQFNREATAKAIAYLSQALERDPHFALAWTELSVAHMREVGWALVAHADGAARGRAAVERALALEPELPEAHTQSAWIKIFYDWDWAGAERSLARARELAPESAPVLRLSGVLVSAMGRPQDSVEIIRRSLEHDPLSAAAYHSLGLALHVVHAFDEAEEAYRKSLDLAPQRIATHAHLAINLLAMNRLDEARAEATREPEEGYRLWALAIIEQAFGNRAASDEALHALIEKHANAWAVQVADVFAMRGEPDEAFRWLELAHAFRDTGLAHTKNNPRLRALHDDPRWSTLLEKMGLHA